MNKINLKKDYNQYIGLRPASEVMKLERLGSFHQSRLSFMRQLLRRINKEEWTFFPSKISINLDKEGVVVKKVFTNKRYYSIVCFVHNISNADRSDRVIAEKWDLTFTLFDGIPDQKAIKRLSQNVPKQENSRMTSSELVLGRANKSLRSWEKIIEVLSKGNQPSKKLIEDVGYLMRTTAVYGSGKFGLADREIIEDRKEFQSPFQAEMLAVYLLRSVVFDLIDYFSSIKGGNNSILLDQNLRRKIGIGNSTGLGMAPFLINHPKLLNNWIFAREKAILKVRKLKKIKKKEIKLFLKLLKKLQNNIFKWKTNDKIQQDKILKLKKDLFITNNFFKNFDDDNHNWNDFYFWIKKNLSTEGQEAIFSLMLEPYENLIDELGSHMSVFDDKYFNVDGSMKCYKLIEIIENQFFWALKTNYNIKKNNQKFWYVSEEKLEPRLGDRFKEIGHEKEQPLPIGRDIKNLYLDLLDFNSESNLSEFLKLFDKHRHVIFRIIETKDLCYSNIHENIISKDIRAVDMLRCKLSFFGANQFDPLSDRWLRICMYQNAPLPEDFKSEYNDFWPY